MNFHFIFKERDKYFACKMEEDKIVKLYNGKKSEIAYQRTMESMGNNLPDYSLDFQKRRRYN